jgi:hypothetical protein
MRRWTGYALLVSRAGGGAPVRDPAPCAVTTLAIATCDRPEALRSSLASYLANFRRHGRNPAIFVADDSSRPQDTLGVLEELRDRHGVRIDYAGRAEKAAFADALALESGVDLEVVRSALLKPGFWPGDTPGTNRNAMLLHAAGEALLCVDDDTECRISEAPGREPGAILTSAQDPFEYWFHSDRGAALAANPEADADLLALHERVLGRDVAGCLEGPLELGAPDPSLFGSRERVVVTVNGLVGDCGVEYFGWQLLLEGASRERLVEREDAYRIACGSREIRRTVRRLTLGHLSSTFSTFLGLDNRELLPPFLPLRRGEDLAFGYLLRKCFEGRFVALLPFTLLHRPADGRRYKLDGLGTVPQDPTIGQILVGPVEAADARLTGGPRERFEALGRRLRELGEADLAEFEYRVGRVLLRIRESARQRAERLLDLHEGRPEYWAEDTRELVRLLREDSSEEFAVPVGLLAEHGRRGGALECQRLVTRFGRLLEAWPALADAARRLRETDVRLGRRL